MNKKEKRGDHDFFHGQQNRSALLTGGSEAGPRRRDGQQGPLPGTPMRRPAAQTLGGASAAGPRSSRVGQRVFRDLVSTGPFHDQASLPSCMTTVMYR